MLFRRIVLAIAAAGLAASGTIAQTTTSSTVTRTSSFVPVGLAISETAQINVVNLAQPAASGGTAPSCTGTISFMNSKGMAIGSATSFTLASGQIASATLPYVTTGATGRTEIRGVVTSTSTRGSGVRCSLSSSLETFDTSTGVTHVFVEGPQDGRAGSVGGQQAGPSGSTGSVGGPQRGSGFDH